MESPKHLHRYKKEKTCTYGSILPFPAILAGVDRINSLDYPCLPNLPPLHSKIPAAQAAWKCSVYLSVSKNYNIRCSVLYHRPFQWNRNSASEFSKTWLKIKCENKQNDPHEIPFVICYFGLFSNMLHLSILRMFNFLGKDVWKEAGPVGSRVRNSQSFWLRSKVLVLYKQFRVSCLRKGYTFIFSFVPSWGSGRDGLGAQMFTFVHPSKPPQMSLSHRFPIHSLSLFTFSLKFF